MTKSMPPAEQHAVPVRSAVIKSAVITSPAITSALNGPGTDDVRSDLKSLIVSGNHTRVTERVNWSLRLAAGRDLPGGQLETRDPVADEAAPEQTLQALLNWSLARRPETPVEIWLRAPHDGSLFSSVTLEPDLARAIAAHPARSAEAWQALEEWGQAHESLRATKLARNDAGEFGVFSGAFASILGIVLLIFSYSVAGIPDAVSEWTMALPLVAALSATILSWSWTQRAVSTRARTLLSWVIILGGVPASLPYVREPELFILSITYVGLLLGSVSAMNIAARERGKQQAPEGQGYELRAGPWDQHHLHGAVHNFGSGQVARSEATGQPTLPTALPSAAERERERQLRDSLSELQCEERALLARPRSPEEQAALMSVRATIGELKEALRPAALRPAALRHTQASRLQAATLLARERLEAWADQQEDGPQAARGRYEA